jgi:hypothetical protein
MCAQLLLHRSPALQQCRRPRHAPTAKLTVFLFFPTPPGIRPPPCAAAAAAWRIFDADATGLHVVPPRRRQLRRQRQGVAATAAAEGHRRVHPPVHAQRRAPQEEGQEQGRCRQGAGGGREQQRRSRRRADKEAQRLIIMNRSTRLTPEAVAKPVKSLGAS